ncbi:MAG: hypothetical protein UX39_C0002G0022 [Candidatus Magasanikbacteria bacterium GW2011_GWA2_46_17]|uniref:Uncharacterized protein n=1 Tax=Candidatus Magasanikbacteria bacterium GW2011_GWA2_46_17 TaxID=1619042 RepID=A0A0G1RB53_9BACT|nr:MAG: hypothetical protein UX39_C0002G0022 [Candidatus Magasanikbacteria bacterium GW2011_GWA2_46_17]HBF67168.1 hypothetical protein [Candidatus Magasanikbacteria bacterium]
MREQESSEARIAAIKAEMLALKGQLGNESTRVEAAKKLTEYAKQLEEMGVVERDDSHDIDHIHIRERDIESAVPAEEDLEEAA